MRTVWSLRHGATNLRLGFPRNWHPFVVVFCRLFFVRTAQGDCLVIRVSISVSGSGSSLFSSRVLARSTEEADSSPPRFLWGRWRLWKKEKKRGRGGGVWCGRVFGIFKDACVPCRRKAILNGSHHFYDHPQVSAKTCPPSPPSLSLRPCFGGGSGYGTRTGSSGSGLQGVSHDRWDCIDTFFFLLSHWILSGFPILEWRSYRSIYKYDY